MRIRSACLLAVSLLIAPYGWTLRAQTAEVTLSGVITGLNKAPIQGAILTAKNQATKEVRTATTDKEGAYSLLLVPGTHEIRVDSADLPKFSVTVEVVADQPNRLDIALVAPTNDGATSSLAISP